jgi:TetR/AcrR family transcriptional regulator, transcriptional repressor of bet genes
MNARDKDGQALERGEPPPERASRIRQRQRLIDACISALHLHGPSHTTVEKVVALADMSPGIVRFYFESKAAMLVASLEFLAAEFEQRVLLPVAALKATPVQALEQLVELYFDPDIASPRKVSVWYSFWGEASSRQEYLEICGNKDEDFAALVRELLERLIAVSGQRHLDADGVALGLIGVLEVLWQGIAFQSEEHIDRVAARRRSLSYLRSIFPQQFTHARRPLGAGARPDTARLPAWAYSNATLFALEREQLFRHAWQMLGHADQLARGGDYLTLDLALERALVLRDQDGTIRAFRNSCRHRPHALLGERNGTLHGSIDCAVHALRYGYDGRLLAGETPGDLAPLQLAIQGGLLFVRAGDSAQQRSGPLSAWGASASLSLGHMREIELAADWKLLVEQWLESALAQRPVGTLGALLQVAPLQLDKATGAVEWRARLNADAPGWTAGHYARLAHGDAVEWQRLYLPPNQLLELRPDGALLLQVIPEAPGRCRIRRFALRAVDASRRQQALNYLARRLIRSWLEQDMALAASIQSGLDVCADALTEAGPVPDALAAFRRSVSALLPQVDPSRPAA